MAERMTLEHFLKAADFTLEEWKLSGANWDVLEAINSDYEKRIPALSSSAENIASRLRNFTGVHSVRTRVKDQLHLLKKIVRKKIDLAAEPSKSALEPSPPVDDESLSSGATISKWHNVDASNYLEVVTDLIGVRALHLFMDECISIDEAIRSTWALSEVPVAYVRKGDHLQDVFIERGGTTALHPFGYRSIHYILTTKPELTEFKVELQVRTIFQEGWSEIDHKIRYPDFSNNPQVAYFLDIFNVLAGSADSMGSFVKDLVRSASEYERRIELATEASLEKDEIILQMKTQLNTLKSNKTLKGNKEAMQVVSGVQDKLSALSDTEKLRRSADIARATVDATRSAALALSGLLYPGGANTIETLLQQRLAESSPAASEAYKQAMESIRQSEEAMGLHLHDIPRNREGFL